MREDAEEIAESIEEARERMQELKKQRDKLLQANQKMAKMVFELEDRLEASGVDISELEGHYYSFESGWQGQENSLIIDDISTNSVESQLKELDRLLEGAEIL